MLNITIIRGMQIKIRLRCHLPSIKMATSKTKWQVLVRMRSHGNTSILWMGMCNSVATVEKSLAVLLEYYSAIKRRKTDMSQHGWNLKTVC